MLSTTLSVSVRLALFVCPRARGASATLRAAMTIIRFIREFSQQRTPEITGREHWTLMPLFSHSTQRTILIERHPMGSTPRWCRGAYGLIRIVPVLLVSECAVSVTAHVPGAMLLGTRKITWVKIEPGVVRTSSAVRL